MFKYIAFHKPFGCLSQFTGEKGDKTLSEFGFPKNVYAAGRLDKDSEGLLLLTDDGPFIKKLLEPKYQKYKTYYVQVENIPTPESLRKLESGVEIKGYLTKPAKVKIIDLDAIIGPRNPPIRERKNIPTCWLEIQICEGKNRQVRRMTASIGHPTLRLIRSKMANLELGELVPGQWREVNKEDIL